MNTIIDYDNFILPATDLAVAKDFYLNKLGLEIKFDFEQKGMIAFKVGGSEPAIILRKAENVKPAILFKVISVRESFEELQQKGIRFTGDPIEINTGLYAEFFDPSGNKFAITDYSKSNKTG